MAELLEDLGHNIRRLREEKRWNQTELGFHADMSPSIISLIENGKRNPSTATLAKIAGALGVEVVELFPKVPAPPSQQPSFENHLRREEETEERREPRVVTGSAHIEVSQETFEVLTALADGEISATEAAERLARIPARELVLR